MKKFKRGDVREDGMVFWAYAKGCKNNEFWKLPDVFKAAQKRVAKNRAVFNNKEFSTKPKHARKILQGVKSRAKAQGIPFNLDINKEIQSLPDNCPIFGIKLSWCERKGIVTKTSPSLDKFKPELGYVEGNVTWISHKANTMKSNASTVEVEALLRWMKQVENQ